MTNLKVNGTLVDDLEDTVHVNNSSVSVVNVNDEAVWEREADLPIAATNFAASSNLEYSITCTWDTAYSHISYALYEETLGVVVDNIDPDDISVTWDNTSAIPPVMETIYTLAIVAIGEEGNVASNSDTGSLLVRGSVVIDRDSYTFTGNGEGTVSVSAGNGVFTPPISCESIEVRISGAGGSGSTFFAIVPTAIGGGYSGLCTKETIDVKDIGSIDFFVGLGGSPVNDDFNGAVGITGGSSSFGDLSLAGGIGGTFVHYGITAMFNGAGESVVKCDETHYNGVIWTSPLLSYFGGEASTFGNGGAGAADGPIAGAPGAGGGSNVGGDGLSSGAGGDGRIEIIW